MAGRLLLLCTDLDHALQFEETLRKQARATAVHVLTGSVSSPEASAHFEKLQAKSTGLTWEPVAAGDVETAVRAYAPSVIATSPVLGARAFVGEGLLAAAAHGTPTLGLVASWAETSRPAPHVWPETIAVWNTAQRQALNKTHRIPPHRVAVIGAHGVQPAVAPPRRTRTDFCAERGVDASLPLILFVAANVAALVEFDRLRAWHAALGSALGGFSTLIATHPAHDALWREVELPPNAVVIRDEELPAAIHHTDAVVTSSMRGVLMAAAAGRRVSGWTSEASGELTAFAAAVAAPGWLSVASAPQQNAKAIADFLNRPLPAADRAAALNIVRPHGIDLPPTLLLSARVFPILLPEHRAHRTGNTGPGSRPQAAAPGWRVLVAADPASLADEGGITRALRERGHHVSHLPLNVPRPATLSLVRRAAIARELAAAAAPGRQKALVRELARDLDAVRRILYRIATDPRIHAFAGRISGGEQRHAAVTNLINEANPDVLLLLTPRRFPAVVEGIELQLQLVAAARAAGIPTVGVAGAWAPPVNRQLARACTATAVWNDRQRQFLPDTPAAIVGADAFDAIFESSRPTRHDVAGGRPFLCYAGTDGFLRGPEEDARFLRAVIKRLRAVDNRALRRLAVAALPAHPAWPELDLTRFEGVHLLDREASLGIAGSAIAVVSADAAPLAVARALGTPAIGVATDNEAAAELREAIGAPDLVVAADPDAVVAAIDSTRDVGPRRRDEDYIRRTFRPEGARVPAAPFLARFIEDVARAHGR